MTDLAAALADRSALEPYAGHEVIKTTISVRNAGDGLSDGMSIDPILLPLGSTQYVVLQCEVDAHTLKRSKDSGDLLVLEQVLKAGIAAIVDGAVVSDMLIAQANKIKAAREAADPQMQVPGTERPAPSVPAAGSPEDEHEQGMHADGLHPHCGECNAERAAAEYEADQRQMENATDALPVGPGIGPSENISVGAERAGLTAVPDLPVNADEHPPMPEPKAKGRTKKEAT